MAEKRGRLLSFTEPITGLSLGPLQHLRSVWPSHAFSVPDSGWVCLYLHNGHTCTQANTAQGLVFLMLVLFSSISQACPTLQDQQEGIHHFKARPKGCCTEARPERGFLLLLVLRPQAMESDKNYLQTGVTKSPFPLEEPSNMKVSCQACSCSIFQSLPWGRCLWATSQRGGNWVSRGLAQHRP